MEMETETDNIALYNRCMDVKEEQTLDHILKMEEQFRTHYALLQKETKVQRELIERMWFLSQRYMMFVSTIPCCKFNEVYSTPPEDVILLEYHEKMQQVRTSNCHLWQSLRGLRCSVLYFRKLCALLDMERESPLIAGDAFHKPLSYFIELIDDLFKYFHSLLLNFKVQAHQMDPNDPFQLEEYKKLLEPSEDFDEYLMQGLVYCKCLRPKQVCDKRTSCKGIPND